MITKICIVGKDISDKIERIFMNGDVEVVIIDKGGNQSKDVKFPIEVFTDLDFNKEVADYKQEAVKAIPDNPVAQSTSDEVQDQSEGEE